MRSTSICDIVIHAQQYLHFWRLQSIRDWCNLDFTFSNVILKMRSIYINYLMQIYKSYLDDLCLCLKSLILSWQSKTLFLGDSESVHCTTQHIMCSFTYSRPRSRDVFDTILHQWPQLFTSSCFDPDARASRATPEQPECLTSSSLLWRVATAHLEIITSY